MKSNSKKCRGFGLIEVVISMAILAIISVAVYDGYIIIIRQTKAGQVKQTAALEGKKIIEEMKSTSFEVPITTGAALYIGNNIELQKEENEDFYTRYLKEDFSVCDKDVSKYVEKITLTSTNVTLNDKQITDELENSNNFNYKVYIGKEKNLSDTVVEDYIKDETTDSPIDSESESNKIVLYVYFETTSNSENDRTIKIKNSKGTELLETTEPLEDTDSSKVNLCINFNNYKPITSVPKLDNSDLKDVGIYVYNRTGSSANIYLQKDSTVTADVKVCKGEINIYDNRAEDMDENNVGNLYDIKLEISDYLKYKNDEIKEDNDNLFTAYYKRNIE